MSKPLKLDLINVNVCLISPLNCAVGLLGLLVGLVVLLGWLCCWAGCAVGLVVLLA